MPGRLSEGPDEINAVPVRVDRVLRVLDVLRPGLIADGGNVELLGVSDDGVVRLELQGACARCPAAEMTRARVLEPVLRAKVPGVSLVVLG